MTGKFNKDIFGLVYITVLTAAALIYGFTTIPSPAQQRDIKLDHQRVSELGELNDVISVYYTDTNVLPKNLDELTTSHLTGMPLAKNDPETDKPYDYIVTSPTSYKLCATFATDSSKEDRYTYDEDNYTYSSFSDTFRHGKGYTCFIRTVEPKTTSPIGGGSSGNTRLPGSKGETRSMPYQVDPVKPAPPPTR